MLSVTILPHSPYCEIKRVISEQIKTFSGCSATFMQWTARELSAENHLSFYIPRGFAHGFATLEDETVMLYQCDGKYHKEHDTGIRFNDPKFEISWPIDEKLAILSERDLSLPNFSECHIFMA